MKCFEIKWNDAGFPPVFALSPFSSQHLQQQITLADALGHYTSDSSIIYKNNDKWELKDASPEHSSGKRWGLSPGPWRWWRGRSRGCRGGCHSSRRCRSCRRRSWPGNWRPECSDHSHTGTGRGWTRCCWAGFFHTSAPEWGWRWSPADRLHTLWTRQRSDWVDSLPSSSCTVRQGRTKSVYWTACNSKHSLCFFASSVNVNWNEGVNVTKQPSWTKQDTWTV